jgi:DNA-binding NarL/FixJ family response regulator
MQHAAPQAWGATIVSTESLKNVGLTTRQQQVLELLRRGESNKLIGRQLNLRESTVKVHLRQIMRKLGVANRTQAALSAERLDIRTTKPKSLKMPVKWMPLMPELLRAFCANDSWYCLYTM